MDMTPHPYDRVELVVALPDGPSRVAGKMKGKWSVSASDELGMTFVRRDGGRKRIESCSQHYQR
ncbi:MAG: hypothetical protein M3008_10975 [Chloroflexota bacterium]|nr:hypothetical protein [Chloroflexota bacterium]